MAVNNTEKLYLIRFLERPYRNVNKYVCVPNSWLIRKLANQVAYVAYPEEEPAITRRRAENHERPGEDWKIFESKVEYESDTYEYADIWAATEEMDQSEENNGVITIQNGDLTDNVHHTRTIVHSDTFSTNGPSNVQIRGEHSRNPLAAFRKKQTTAKRPELSRLYNPLADSRNRESLQIHSNSLLHSPEMVNKFILERDDKLDSYLNNVKQTTAAMSNSSKQLHHLSKNPDQQRISVVTDNFLHYGNSNQILLDKNVMEGNDNYQTNQDMTPATQSLINLMKRQSLSSHIIQGNTLNVNDQPHQTQSELEIPYEPTEGYCIGQINQTTNVTNNTPSAVLYKHINEQQLPPAFTNHLQPNPCVDNMIVRRTTGGNSLNLLNISQNNTNNTQPAYPSPIIENNFDQSLKAVNPFQTSANVQNGVKRVRRKRRCFTVKSTTANTQNTPSAVLKPPTDQSLQNSQNAHPKEPLPVLKGYLFQNPQTKLLYISNLPLVKDNHQSVSVQNTTQNVHSAPQIDVTSTNQSNQPLNHFEDLNENSKFPMHYCGAVPPNLHAQQMFQKRSVTYISTDKTVNPQMISLNIPLVESNPLNTKTCPPSSCICLHGNRFSSITPSHSYQDNQNPLNSESTVENCCRQNAHTITNTEDRSCAGQNSINLPTYEQPFTQADQIYIRNSCSQSITANNLTAKNSSDQANQPLTGQHSPMTVDFSEKVIGVEKMPDNDLVKILKLKIAKSAASSCPRTTTKYGSTGSQRSSNELNKFEAKTKETLLNDFKLLFSKMNSNLSVSYEAYKNLQKSNAKYDKTLKRIIGIVTKQYTFIIDHVLSSKSKKVKKLRNKLRRKKAKKHDSNNDLNHEDNEECYEA